MWRIVVTLVCLCVVSCNATAREAISDGDYSFGDLWEPMGTVQAGDELLIPVGRIVTFTGSPNVGIGNLTIKGTLIFASSSVSLSVQDLVDIDGGNIIATEPSLATRFASGSNMFRIAGNNPIIQGGGTPYDSGRIFPIGSQQQFIISTDFFAQDVDFPHTMNCTGARRTMTVRGQVGFSMPQFVDVGADQDFYVVKDGSDPATIFIPFSTIYPIEFFVDEGVLKIDGTVGTPVVSLGCLRASATNSGIFNLTSNIELRPEYVRGNFIGQGLLTDPDSASTRAVRGVPTTGETRFTAVNFMDGKVYRALSTSVKWFMEGVGQTMLGDVEISFPRTISIADNRLLLEKANPTFVRKFAGLDSTHGSVELVDNAVLATSKTSVQVPFLGSGAIQFVQDPTDMLPHLLDCDQATNVFVPDSVQFIWSNAGTPINMRCNVSARSWLPALGRLVIAPAEFPNGLTFANNSIFAGTIAFSETDVNGDSRQAFSSSRGQLFFKDNVELKSTCKIETLGNASAAAQLGLLEFLTTTPASINTLVGFEQCSVVGSNSSFVLKFKHTDTSTSSGHVIYSLPVDLQVGYLFLSGPVHVRTQNNASITNPYIVARSTSTPAVTENSEYLPGVRMEGLRPRFSIYTPNTHVNVVGEFIFLGESGEINVEGANSLLRVSSFKSQFDISTDRQVRLRWGDRCTKHEQGAGADFPRIEVVTSICQASCGQVSPLLTSVNFIIDTTKYPFKDNTTFLIVDDPNNDADLKPVQFVNTGGLTFESGFDRFTTTGDDGTNFTYRRYYFFNTSIAPGFFSCDRSDCEQIEFGNGQTFNTCDPPRALIARLSQKIKGNMEALSLRVEDGSDLDMEEGSSLTILGALEVLRGSMIRLRPGVIARIGAALTLGGNLTVELGAATRVNGTITFESGAQIVVQGNGGSTTPFQSEGLVEFAGNLILQIVRSLSPLREVVASELVVPVASYSQASGSLESVSVVSDDSNACDTVLASDTQQTGSSLSVVVNVATDTSVEGCESTTDSGPVLSTGAIIGIAVGGTILFALLVVLLVICCRKRELAKQNAIFMSNAYEKDLNRMSQMTKAQ